MLEDFGLSLTKDETILASSMSHVYAGPAVRKLARELGVDLTLIQGSGAKNRMVKMILTNLSKRVWVRQSSASRNTVVARAWILVNSEVEEKRDLN